MFIPIVLFCVINTGYSQHKSINLSLYGSNYLDKAKDQDYDYEIIYDGFLAQFALEYSSSLNEKISLNTSLGISVANGRYENFQRGFGDGFSPEDRTYISKQKRITYIKMGSGVTYWLQSAGKGVHFRTDFRLNILLSANSIEEKKFDDNPLETYKLSFKSDMKTIVPTFILGVGYNLNVTSKFYLNAGLYFDLRFGSYFKGYDQYNLVNRGLRLGFGYLLSTDKVTEKD